MPLVEGSEHRQQQTLRRRRMMFHQMTKNAASERDHKLSIASNTRSSSNYLLRFYTIIISIMIIVVLGVLLYVRPDILYKSIQQPSKIVLQGWFPPDISPKLDLPVLFSTYAVANPENAKTRRALTYIRQSAKILSHPKLQQVYWIVGERPNPKQQSRRHQQWHEMCGLKITNVTTGNNRSDDDLFFLKLHWCFLSKHRSQGYIEFGSSSTPLFPSFEGYLTPRSNIAIELPQRRISTDFIVIPFEGQHKTNVSERVFEWMTASTMTSQQTGDIMRDMLETKLYEWIQEPQERVKWVLGRTKCDGNSSEGSMTDQTPPANHRLVAIYCPSKHVHIHDGAGEKTTHSCCQVYLPLQNAMKEHRRISSSLGNEGSSGSDDERKTLRH